MTLFVSAGHHANDPGAVFGDFIEHEEAVRWRDLIVASLFMQEQPAIAVPTGTLIDKVSFINKAASKAHSIAIEVHFNAGGTPGVTAGSETLYCPGSQAGEMMARIVQERIADIFMPDRGIKPGYFRMEPSKPVDFFLRKTRCPAVIIEPEFVHNAVKIRANRERACVEIAAALMRVHEIVQDSE